MEVPRSAPRRRDGRRRRCACLLRGSSGCESTLVRGAVRERAADGPVRGRGGGYTAAGGGAARGRGGQQEEGGEGREAHHCTDHVSSEECG